MGRGSYDISVDKNGVTAKFTEDRAKRLEDEAEKAKVKPKVSRKKKTSVKSEVTVKKESAESRKA